MYISETTGWLAYNTALVQGKKGPRCADFLLNKRVLFYGQTFYDQNRQSVPIWSILQPIATSR